MVSSFFRNDAGEWFLGYDNQARFLNWVAKGAQPAPVQEAAAFKEAKASVSAKPWLGRPTYRREECP